MTDHAMTTPGKGAVRSIAMLTSGAATLANFRGPLIGEFVSHGITVYALAPDHDADTRAAMEQLGAIPVDVSLERTGMHPLRDLRDMFGLVRTFRRLKPDAVFGYFIKPVTYGTIAARLAGVQRRFAMVAGLGYVFTPGAGPDTLKRRVLRGVASSLYWLAFRLCRVVFVQNEDDRSFFIDNGIAPAGRIELLAGSGVDLDRLSPAPAVTAPVTFLLMARLLREKGIAEFVEAARLLRADYPDARFVLLGGWDPNPGGFTLEEVRAWVDEGLIEWPGHQSDVRPIIAQSSVFVLPSYREGKPRSTQEAMAMARPIVTTDAPGCRDTVVEGYNGFLVPARDPVPLAQAMKRFLDQPELIEPMGAASRQLAEERFDVRRINAHMLRAMGIAG